MNSSDRWDADFDPRSVCLTIDVEWAHFEVLADLVRLFDAAGVTCTFFVTHEGVDVGQHERGLHPNFRRDGDTVRSVLSTHVGDEISDGELYEAAFTRTYAFAPEALGYRSHGLRSDSSMIPIARRCGLQYDCTMRLPLVAGLRPIRLEYDLLAIPTFYADHFDMKASATGFDVKRLGLDRAGLKVFDFHPNMVFLNSPTDEHYQATRSFYHDPERLLAHRFPGRGTRTMLLDLLETVRKQDLPTLTAGEINRRWRGSSECRG